MVDPSERGLDHQRDLDRLIQQPQIATLGTVVAKTNIESSIGPFQHLPEYRTTYPEAVTRGLGDLYGEYNKAFAPLVAANREWETDYQHAMGGPDGTPVNYFVQVDMVGLPDNYLQAVGDMSPDRVREDLRRRIFEIENSLAMYQLLERMFEGPGQDSVFKSRFRETLDTMRRLHGRPIALLAVTEQKHQAMRESEFGKAPGQPLPPDEVARLSGFDAFFGPQEFADHVRENGGDSGYLLYVRSSDPVARLKNPNAPVENPLLENDDMRRVIKAHAVTFNIDKPNLPPGHPSRINDTKEYMGAMRMAHIAHQEGDLLDPQFDAYLRARGSAHDYVSGERLSAEFGAYLASRGVAQDHIQSGVVPLRAKPMKGAYGCYGHISGSVMDRRFRQEFRRSLRDRGSYVVQPEMPSPIICNENDGTEYVFIDRNFLATTDGSTFTFVGGFRSLMPVDSHEAAQGRNHGSRYTVWGEIV